MASDAVGRSSWKATAVFVASAVADQIARRAEPPPVILELPPKVDFLETVKLIHSEQLRDWTRFPRYEEVELVSHAEYNAEHTRVRSIWRRHEISQTLGARLSELDRDDMVATPSFEIVVPAAWRWKPVRLPAPRPSHGGAILNPSKGRVEGGELIVTTRWWPQRVLAHYDVPKRTLHSDEISRLAAELATADSVESADIEAVRTSRFQHPVLFISHRWATAEHPDPTGAQLERLRLLKNCFIIYDYTSFPQVPSGVVESDGLRAILDNMQHLLKNVVVLGAPDYTDRGWCAYEYLGACLNHSIVCDEIQDERFVRLRDWAATQAPMATNTYHDGWESMMDNRISLSTLAAMNALGGTLSEARFSLDQDRATVRRLLVALLKDRLPSKKTLGPHGGETSKARWTPADLEYALDAGFSLPEMSAAVQMRPSKVAVPTSLEEAVDSGYAIRIHATPEYRRHQVWSPFAPLIAYQDRYYKELILPS